MSPIVLLDTVALLRDVAEVGLKRGDVGAVVLEVDANTVVVEFVNEDGSTFASPALPRSDLLRLNHEHMAAE